MVDGLAFLRIQDVEEGITYLLRGPGNNPLAIILRRTPPVFPPELWNMNEITVSGNARTNNNIRTKAGTAFRSLVGHSNPSICTLLKEFQLDRSLNINAFNQLQKGTTLEKNISKHNQPSTKIATHLQRSKKMGL